MRSLVAGIILGVVIASIWAGLKRTPPKPPRKGKIIDIYETGEYERVVS
jgi:hypothetical protein